MPAGSGHGFVQLVSCGLRAALFYDLLSAPGAEEQDFALCGRFDRRSYRGRCQTKAEGHVRDLQGASPLTHNPWQHIGRYSLFVQVANQQ